MDARNSTFTAGLQPNIKTFNILMNAAAKENDLNATEHWFQVALAKGVKPDSAMLKTLLTTAPWIFSMPCWAQVVWNGNEVSAFGWYNKAKQRSVLLTNASVTSIAMAAARKGKLDFARLLVEDGHQQKLGLWLRGVASRVC